MCFAEPAIVVVDELTTEFLRHFARVDQTSAISRVISNVLSTDVFTEDGRPVGKVTKERMKILLRRVYARLPVGSQKAEMLLQPDENTIGRLKSGAPKGLSFVGVRRFRQEMLKELFNACPPRIVGEVIFKASLGAEDRLTGTNELTRIQREFFRPMAVEFKALGGEVTNDLALQVGLEEDFQVPLPGTDSPQVEPETEEPEIAETESDEFHFDIPSYEDYDHVFDSYPFVQLKRDSGSWLLVLGYQSYRKEHQLIRRNCAVSFKGQPEISFKSLATTIGVLTKEVGENHQYVKACPVSKGDYVRFWTNVKDEGDQESYNRYYLVLEDQDEDLFLRRYPSKERMLAARDALLSQDFVMAV